MNVLTDDESRVLAATVSITLDRTGHHTANFVLLVFESNKPLRLIADLEDAAVVRRLLKHAIKEIGAFQPLGESMQ